MSIISQCFEAPITNGAGISADWKGQRVNHLDSGLLLPAARHKQAPDFGLDLPQISRLSHKGRTLSQIGKEMPVVAVKIVEEVFISGVLEIFATQFHRDDLFIRQCWSETAAPDGVSFFHSFVSFDYQTINANDKTISIHRTPPANG